MIKFKYNKKGELEAREDGKMIGKMNQTPEEMFPGVFKKEEKEENNSADDLTNGKGDEGNAQNEKK